MPEGTSNSVLNLGEISKPANTLINKISEAVGGVFMPFQIIRVAKAEAEAAIIKTQNDSTLPNCIVGQPYPCARSMAQV